MRSSIITLICGLFSVLSFAQQPEIAVTTSPFVNFDEYLRLANEVNVYRKDRIITLESFNQLAAQPNVVILDTRSDSLFKAKHVKGAIHLNFSDFTQDNLFRLIPDQTTCILIYCNNNFMANAELTIEDLYFPTKMALPVFPESISGSLIQKQKSSGPNMTMQTSNEGFVTNNITLALNIPTFINLYGYGYRNVYELGELVSTNDPRLQFEGTAVGIEDDGFKIKD